jgi:hypothetical protein
LDKLRVYSALQNKIFKQAPDLVVGKASANGGPESKAAAKTARDVILAASFPNPELPRTANTVLARIEAEHYLAQGNQVIAAGARRFKVQRRGEKPSRSSGGGIGCGSGGSRLGFAVSLFALEVSSPAFSFFDLIVLFAHFGVRSNRYSIR